MRLAIIALVTALAFVAGASNARAQVLKKIKQQTKEKIDKRVEKAEENMVTRAGQVVDSTVEKTGRGVDTVVSKFGTAADTVLNKTERGVSSAAGAVTGAFKGSDTDATKLSEDLADGRAVAMGVVFVSKTEQLEPSSRAAIKRLAKVLAGLQGPYLVEGHVAPSADPAADQALSERRAAAVKAGLVADGIPVTRLFSMGFGGMRPPLPASDGRTPNADRIEISRMQ